jgi:hypothetical protein
MRLFAIGVELLQGELVLAIHALVVANRRDADKT